MTKFQVSKLYGIRLDVWPPFGVKLVIFLESLRYVERSFALLMFLSFVSYCSSKEDLLSSYIFVLFLSSIFILIKFFFHQTKKN